MAKYAIPMIFQQSCVALFNVVIQTLVNSYATVVIAGYTAGSKLSNFVYMCFNTLGNALSSFTAQCYGAEKYGRILEGLRVSTALCFGFFGIVLLLFEVFPRQLVSLFFNAAAEDASVEVGVTFLRIVGPIYGLILIILTIGGLLRGVGRSLVFFIETIIEFIVRVAMCFVLTRVLDSYTGILWAWYFGPPLGFFICLVLLFRERKKLLRLDEVAR